MTLTAEQIARFAALAGQHATERTTLAGNQSNEREAMAERQNAERAALEAAIEKAGAPPAPVSMMPVRSAG